MKFRMLVIGLGENAVSIDELAQKKTFCGGRGLSTPASGRHPEHHSAGLGAPGADVSAVNVSRGVSCLYVLTYIVLTS